MLKTIIAALAATTLLAAMPAEARFRSHYRHHSFHRHHGHHGFAFRGRSQGGKHVGERYGRNSY